MIVLLRIALIIVWLWMVFVVVSTSLESNLFKEWGFLSSIPWMQAILWDFYGNMLVIYTWLCYKEQNILKCIIWAILFFCLGSIASIAYLIWQLFKVKSTSTFTEVFARTN